MTIEDIKLMKKYGFNNYKKEEVFNALAIVRSSKDDLKVSSKELTALEKELEAEINNQMEVGEQMSLDLGPTTYTSTIVELDEIGINCDEAILYTACLKAGLTSYLKNSINLTAIKKDYKNGSLHPDLLKYIVVTKQQAMKFSKKAKKEEE